MKLLMIFLLALMTAGVCCAAETEADFYVSPSGSDNWSGTLATPNAQASDGPFATLTQSTTRSGIWRSASRQTSLFWFAGNLPVGRDGCFLFEGFRGRRLDRHLRCLSR